MSERRDLRCGIDRRRQPRGGRRDGDFGDPTPLVLLVGDQPSVIGPAEAILARLRFAVSLSDTVDDAVRILPSLRPDLVVARQGDAPRLRIEAPEGVPVVEMGDGTVVAPEALVEEIRRALRARRQGP